MRRICVPVIAALLCAAAAPALAQADAAPAPSARAQRDAEKVFHWIRVHSDKPRRWGDQKERDASPSRPAAAVAPGRPAPVAAAAPAVAGAPATLPAPQAAAPQPTSPEPVPAAPLPRATASAPVPAASPSPVAPAAPLVSDEPAAAPAAPAASQVEGHEPDDEALTLVEQAEPRFSSHVMQTLRKGTVQVRFEVRADGSVGQAEVVRSTSARLHGAALAAVAQWRFQPLRKPQTGLVELGFNLD